VWFDQEKQLATASVYRIFRANSSRHDSCFEMVDGDSDDSLPGTTAQWDALAH
jgi:hypothetical protein